MSMLLTDDSPVCASAPVRPPRPPIEMRQADPAGRLPRPPDGRWLAVLPPARQVLAVGEEAALLAPWHRQQHAQARWQAVPLPVGGEAVAPALPPAGSIDLLLLSPGFFALTDADRWLARLGECCAPGARLSLALDNGCTLERMARLLEAGTAAAGDPQHDPARAHAPATVYKLLLDAGWLPDLKAQRRTEVPESVFSARLIAAAMALGLPRQTAQRNLGLQTMVVVCEKLALQPPSAATRYAPFSVIVPVNRPFELALNIERSPGLREVGAQVIPVVGARSAADAFERGAAQATQPWRLFVHQDVYFATGTGFMIAERLGTLQADGRHAAPVGFAGLHGEQGPAGPVRYAGQVVDRTQLFDHPASSSAVSIDEFAIALHADSPLAPDASLGWHLWATDLCLQALVLGGAPCGEILRVPLFHNSTTGYTLPAEFHESAQVLLDKYTHLSRVSTLCGLIERKVPQALAA